jgi:hypothetical protein
VLNLNDGSENEIVEEIHEEEVKKYFDEDEIEDGNEIMFDFIKGDKEDDRKVKEVSKIKEKNGEKKIN